MKRWKVCLLAAAFITIIVISARIEPCEDSSGHSCPRPAFKP